MILPGVQVLFAFLLVVPFNQRFADVSTFQKYLYLGTLLCAAAASACLIAPSIHHRITFRTQDKEHLVVRANRLTIVGGVFLALAMTGAIWLITGLPLRRHRSRRWRRSPWPSCSPSSGTPCRCFACGGGGSPAEGHRQLRRRNRFIAALSSAVARQLRLDTMPWTSSSSPRT